MAISLKTRVMLWGRSGNRCAFPECKIELAADATQTDDEALIGDICHIVARSTDGPRGNSPLGAEQRDKYSNLLLLCKNHHKVIDSQPGKYGVEDLQEMKKTHEIRIRTQLKDFDDQERQDNEIYASYIEEWSSQVRLAEWKDWGLGILSRDQPEMESALDDSLEHTRAWLLSRIWPRRHATLERAFENFRCVLSDFQETFRKYAERDGTNKITRKIYNIDTWDPELYDRMYQEYDRHVGLTGDLFLELTRAANHVCDCVRASLDPTFRFSDGVLLAQTGITTSLKSSVFRPEYKRNEIESGLYPGVEDFSKKARYKRDVYFGSEFDFRDGATDTGSSA